jgi:hypothetical protein
MVSNLWSVRNSRVYARANVVSRCEGFKNLVVIGEA